MSKTAIKKTVFMLGLAGFLGAAVFYSPYLGLDAQNRYACPLCPHVTIVGGTPMSRFLRLALPMGFLNAILFSAIGWIALKVAIKLKHLIDS